MVGSAQHNDQGSTTVDLQLVTGEPRNRAVDTAVGFPQ